MYALKKKPAITRVSALRNSVVLDRALMSVTIGFVFISLFVVLSSLMLEMIAPAIGAVDIFR